MSDSASINVVDANLFELEVDAIVNPYNRNVVPWWLLVPGGISGQIKKRAGTAPYRQLARYGRLSSGQAVTTDAGKLTGKIIHVACIEWYGRSSIDLVHSSIENIVVQAKVHHLQSVAIPLLGAGHGKLSQQQSQKAIIETLQGVDLPRGSMFLVVRPPASLTR